VVVCLERGADLHMATATHCLLLQIGSTFLVLALPGSPGQRAVKLVCACVCVCLCVQWLLMCCVARSVPARRSFAVAEYSRVHRPTIDVIQQTIDIMPTTIDTQERQSMTVDRWFQRVTVACKLAIHC